MFLEDYYQQFLKQNPYPRELKNYNKNKLIDFSHNDYLGLAHHPLLLDYAHQYAQRYGIGSTSSRSVSGNLEIYEEIEIELARALGKPAALIMGTGFQTNLSVLDALLDPNVLGNQPLIFCDRLCHASMLTNLRYHARLHRFQHNDLRHLQILLDKYVDDERPKYILAESLYSMEGDQADLQGLVRLATQYKAFLYIDDAHAVGVYGEHGWGKASEYTNEIDIIMGTFSKALGSFGGYIACSQIMREYLINKCKGLIYSTALSPAILGAIKAALELIPTLEDERKTIIKNADRLRQFFKENTLDCGSSNSHIVPWIIGDAQKNFTGIRIIGG